MHLCNRWGTSEIKIFRASDYAHIGSVKLLEDADSIGFTSPTAVAGRASSTPPQFPFSVLTKVGETGPSNP